MATELEHYLADLRDNLRLDPSSEGEVINELETHIEDRLQELKEAGLSEEEAVSTCVRLLGSTKLVARQIYEAHSQGTWKHVLFASMPHLLFALLFALNWWRGNIKAYYMGIPTCRSRFCSGCRTCSTAPVFAAAALRASPAA